MTAPAPFVPGLSPELAALDAGVTMPTYGRYPVEFVRGEGCRLWDVAGNEYLDFMAGIAVVSVGHCRKEITAAVSEQMSSLVHTTNLFYTRPQFELAVKIQAIAGWGKVFFANSGAEANECALKLARLHARAQGLATNGGPVRVVALEGSFHGRTLGTLGVTGQPSKQAPFEPLDPGAAFVPLNDIAALEGAMGGDCESGAAAVLLEVVQGEGGVWPADPEYLLAARKLCDETGALLVFDEVQTGLCRTGSWLAFEQAGVEPDVYTLGKALGNGLPIAACVARPEVADLFKPGMHGTTMGGGPVVCRAALEVLKIMEDEEFATAANEKGAVLSGGLAEIDGVTSVRGRGLLVAGEIEGDAAAVCAAALRRGLLANPVTPTAVRMSPPLVVSEAEIGAALEILARAIEEAA